MPFTIDESKMQAKPQPGQDVTVVLSLDPHKPPVKVIPHFNFPRVVYQHPNEPYRIIEHRNARHELVEEEVVQAEALTKMVSCKAHEIVGAEKCAECEKALKKAVEEGWTTEVYVPPALPDRNAGLYAKTKK